MNCEQAKKKVDFVEYLEFLNHFPKKIIRGEYKYLSPLRNEKEPSFFVNREKGTFHDFGDGNGGTIIDFGIQYHRCTIAKFLALLDEYMRLPGGKKRPGCLCVAQTKTVSKQKDESEEEQKIQILSIEPITSAALIHYFHTREVSPVLAKQFCCEVNYQLYGNAYYAIGFKADAGGYELGSKHIKLSSKPKGCTFIDRGLDAVAVFEGFFSFLSFLEIMGDWEALEMNFLILNSLSFLNQSKILMDRHKRIFLYLDRDEQGINRALQLMNESRKYRNGSIAYRGFRDWNKYLIHIKTVKPQV